MEQDQLRTGLPKTWISTLLKQREIILTENATISTLHMFCVVCISMYITWFPQIYFATEEYGLDSTVTSRGYFLMADVFTKQGKMPTVRSLYSEVSYVLIALETKFIFYAFYSYSFAHIVGGTYLALSPDQTSRDSQRKHPKSTGGLLLWFVAATLHICFVYMV